MYVEVLQQLQVVRPYDRSICDYHGQQMIFLSREMLYVLCGIAQLLGFIY